VRLKTFGALSLTQHSGQCDEAKIQKRQLTVLAILAAERPAGMSRERLLGLLWSGKEQEKARQLLTQAIHAARKALGEQVILEESARLKLNSELLPSDVDDFLASVSRGDFEAAAAAYTGPYLDAVYVPDALEFEHWVEEKRSLLARQFVEALVILARGAQTAANHELAAAYYRRAAANDPFSSTITHAFMTALASAGDVTAALNVGRVYASLVRQELEAEPDARVQQLMRELRAGNELEIDDSQRDLYASSSETTRVESPEERLVHEVPVANDAFTTQAPLRIHSSRTVIKWLIATTCLTIFVWGAWDASARTQSHSTSQSLSSQPYRRASAARETAPISLDATDARVLYLQGQTLLGRRTLVSMQRAIKLFREAIRRDEQFAPAYASLALANALLPSFENHAPAALQAEARTAAARALSLDSGSAPAYVALG
jgi:DNA-binding SARP family transcriptional activator